MSVLTNIGLTALGMTAVGGAAFKAAQNVNVVNTPNVTVTNTPNVNVPNGVAVTTMPSVRIQDDREPVHFSLSLTANALGNETASGFYVVPAGKRLYITHMSGSAGAPTGVYVSLLALTIGAGNIGTQATREFAALSYMPGENSDHYTIATYSEALDTTAESGENIGIAAARSSAFVGSGDAYIEMRVDGYLKANP